MSGLKFSTAVFSVETNKTVSERSRLEVNHVTSRTALRTAGGYNDEALGAVDRRNKCGTCHATKEQCYGHHGSYKLNYPIIQQILMSELINLLKVVCHNCHRPRAIVGNRGLKQLAASKTACVHCLEPAAEVTKNKFGTGVLVTYQNIPRHQLSNKKIFKILNSITPVDAKALGIVAKLNAYLIWRVDITPVSVRVELPRGNKQSQVPDITLAYKNLIEANDALNLEAITGDSPDLLGAIDVMTAEYYKGTVGLPGHPSLNLAVSLKHKEGLIRSRIMGRRVSNISRSVITGDANLKPHEIGLNVNIASAIAIQERVTEFNLTKLRALVANGDHWPGAKHVSLKTGSLDAKGHPIMKKIRLYDSNRKEIIISPGDIVWRHLQDGDFALLNRQPTLMAQSMAGMQVRISFTSFTITLNPGSCAPFNADFDGDNMNCSFATTTAAMNELRTLSMFSRWTENHQSISFTLGAFQDSVIGSAKLSMEKEIPEHIARKICANPKVFSRKSSQGNSPQGTPQSYSGHQLLSKIIPDNINISKKALWDGKPLEVVKGQIVSGVVDKGNAGQAVEGSLFHEISINNGPDNALESLSLLQGMIKRYQGYYTVATISARDVLFDYKAIAKIRNHLRAQIAKVECLYDNAYNNRLKIPAGKTLEKTVEDEEFKIMDTAGFVNKAIVEHIDKHDNNILRLIATGTRGNMSSATSIFGTVGYVTVDGGRMPYNLGNRVYLSSPNYPIDPVHKGCILNSFRTGVSNREIFAAATDARESFISNSLNTAIAGTLTRNLNRCMDSMIIDYFYGIVTSQKLIQTLCYDIGFSLHRLVKVTLTSLALPKKAFVERYCAGSTAGSTGSTGSAGPQDATELLEERNALREAFLEANLNPGDPVDLPFDINREILNAINNFPELEGGKLTESTVPLRLGKVLAEVDKIFFNRARIAEPTGDMLAALRLIKFSIQAELSLTRLKALGVGDAVLDIILAGIMPGLVRSLVSPCEAIGVMLSYILGEPLTQYSLDSKHRSGGAGGQNLDAMVRMREIFACKPAVGKLMNGKVSPAMEVPLMFIHVKEDRRDEIEDFVNDLEMASLRKITKNVSILFEEKNKSQAFPQDNRKGRGDANSGFIRWCLRFELDNKAFKEGRYDAKEVINNLAAEEPNLHFEFTRNSSDGTHAIRVYIKESMFDIVASETKRYRGEKIAIADVHEKPMLLLDPLAEYLLGVRVRGVKNIVRATIEDKKEVYLDENDAVKTRFVPQIILIGFNSDVLFKDYVDEEKSWTNSIMDTNDIYGLSAARERLIDELNGTLSKYAKQHCTVLADQMASTGRITTIHRNGIIARERKNVMLHAYERGPFKTFTDAGIKGVTQRVSGPTPSIMTGQRLDAGTGRVTIVTRD